MRKKRILIANDAHWLGTGYAVYGKELLSRLHNTGKYDIAELCCYANSEMCEAVDVPWTLYGNALSKDAPEEKKRAYGSNPTNAFGLWQFENVLIHFKPDIVFDMRDYWMCAYQEAHVFRPFYRWVAMPTVDSAPQNTSWLPTFSNMDWVIPYTEWAEKVLSQQCRSSINLFPGVANAGVDLDMFKPHEDKKLLKKELFDNENISLTGCVMRNQKRKLFPDIIKSYRAYLDRLLEKGDLELYNNSYLYLQTTYPETNGWDLPGLLLEHRMLDKTLVTTGCTKCGAIYSTKFHEPILQCHNCKERSAILPSVSMPIPTEALIRVYQSFDLFLQIAICEGFGMPQVEAAACGVPIASLDYSAMSEIVRKLDGYPVPVKTLFREMETGADRALPDNFAITDIISNFFSMTETEKEEKSKKTRKLCEMHYSWDKVAEIWDRALDSVDISKNIPWDAPKREINVAKKVPQGLGVYDFFEFIFTEILQEPWLLNTSIMIQIQSDLSNGFKSSGIISKVEHQHIIQVLERYMKNKQALEEARLNPKEHLERVGFKYE